MAAPRPVESKVSIGRKRKEPSEVALNEIDHFFLALIERKNSIEELIASKLPLIDKTLDGSISPLQRNILIKIRYFNAANLENVNVTQYFTGLYQWYQKGNAAFIAHIKEIPESDDEKIIEYWKKILKSDVIFCERLSNLASDTALKIIHFKQYMETEGLTNVKAYFSSLFQVEDLWKHHELIGSHQEQPSLLLKRARQDPDTATPIETKDVMDSKRTAPLVASPEIDVLNVVDIDESEDVPDDIASQPLIMIKEIKTLFAAIKKYLASDSEESKLKDEVNVHFNHLQEEKPGFLTALREKHKSIKKKILKLKTVEDLVSLQDKICKPFYDEFLINCIKALKGLDDAAIKKYWDDLQSNFEFGERIMLYNDDEELEEKFLNFRFYMKKLKIDDVQDYFARLCKVKWEPSVPASPNDYLDQQVEREEPREEKKAKKTKRKEGHYSDHLKGLRSLWPTKANNKLPARVLGYNKLNLEPERYKKEVIVFLGGNTPLMHFIMNIALAARRNTKKYKTDSPELIQLRGAKFPNKKWEIALLEYYEHCQNFIVQNKELYKTTYLPPIPKTVADVLKIERDLKSQSAYILEIMGIKSEFKPINWYMPMEPLADGSIQITCKPADKLRHGLGIPPINKNQTFIREPNDDTDASLKEIKKALHNSSKNAMSVRAKEYPHSLKSMDEIRRFFLDGYKGELIPEITTNLFLAMGGVTELIGYITVIAHRIYAYEYQNSKRRKKQPTVKKKKKGLQKDTVENFPPQWRDGLKAYYNVCVEFYKYTPEGYHRYDIPPIPAEIEAMLQVRKNLQEEKGYLIKVIGIPTNMLRTDYTSADWFEEIPETGPVKLKYKDFKQLREFFEIGTIPALREEISESKRAAADRAAGVAPIASISRTRPSPLSGSLFPAPVESEVSQASLFAGSASRSRGAPIVVGSAGQMESLGLGLLPPAPPRAASAASAPPEPPSSSGGSPLVACGKFKKPKGKVPANSRVDNLQPVAGPDGAKGLRR